MDQDLLLGGRRLRRERFLRCVQRLLGDGLEPGRLVQVHGLSFGLGQVGGGGGGVLGGGVGDGPGALLDGRQDFLDELGLVVSLDEELLGLDLVLGEVLGLEGEAADEVVALGSVAEVGSSRCEELVVGGLEF